jgi:hypothetical protein
MRSLRAGENRMEAVSSHSFVSQSRRVGARWPRRFEQDTPVTWVAVIPLVMASTVAIIWWMHALAHRH